MRLFTRNGIDWTDRYPRISEAVAGLRTASATIDGEAVWCDGDGLAASDKLHSPPTTSRYPSTPSTSSSFMVTSRPRLHRP